MAAVLAAPLGLSVGPAAAATTNDLQTGSLTFATYGGSALTCSLTGSTTRDSEGPREAVIDQYSRPSTPPADGDSTVCNGTHTSVATFTDSGGVTRRLRGFATGTGDLITELEGVFSDLEVTRTVTFDACDGGASATCTLSLTTAPK